MKTKISNWLSRLTYKLALKSALRNINRAIEEVHQAERYLDSACVDVDFFDDVDRLYCRLDDIEKLLSDNTKMDNGE
jgi:hypothetical protein